VSRPGETSHPLADARGSELAVGRDIHRARGEPTLFFDRRDMYPAETNPPACSELSVGRDIYRAQREPMPCIDRRDMYPARTPVLPQVRVGSVGWRVRLVSVSEPCRLGRSSFPWPTHSEPRP